MPFPSPGDLPNPGIEHGSPALQAHCLWSEPPGKPWATEHVVTDLWSLLAVEVVLHTLIPLQSWWLYFMRENIGIPANRPQRCW